MTRKNGGEKKNGGETRILEGEREERRELKYVKSARKFTKKLLSCDVFVQGIFSSYYFVVNPIY